MYYIESDSVLAVTHRISWNNIDVYIEAGIQIKPDKASEQANTCHAIASQLLYKVSENEIVSESQQTPKEDTEEEERLKPKTKKKLQFQLNKSFKNAFESEGSYLYALMPIWITPVAKPQKRRQSEKKRPESFDIDTKIVKKTVSVPIHDKKVRSPKFSNRQSIPIFSQVFAKEPETQVVGSLIYEDPVNGELNLNIYTSPLNSVNSTSFDYPQ